ncbi:Cupredoxin [Pseudomassariella vexata]|uniref:Cupredoxin n=1 Tax=Pseudomassariella vexata TaxID=1141098 RepID=A0A1Y2DJ81_9PEZI|nr:Cupredoxin [Pseudomassariella vexata]ORY59204.1 Cupredoxin [Pseudomassariella vexata]
MPRYYTDQVCPDRRPATIVVYDGISTGPIFKMEKGTESVVCFINKAKMNNSVHLHGSYSRAPFDGWAEDTTKPGEYKDCYYPNNQTERMLWYHDHAIDHTPENAYFGQAGVYLLHDVAEDSLSLPSGPYDIPLVLSAKQYNNDGTLYSPAATSLYGDIIHVNSQPWPYFKAEPPKYRFRLLDASISRSFLLYFESTRNLKSGRSRPQKVQELYISMAERYEIGFDFSKYKGKNVTLRNTRGFAFDTDYLHTNKMMRFVVSGNIVQDRSDMPNALRTIPYPPDMGVVDHHFKFEMTGGRWMMNGVMFSDVKNRVLAKPARGRVEVWELENSTYHAPWVGVYMFHCHNLIHEDHKMMATFNVSYIADLGYDETHYIDPMEPRWRAKPQISADFTDDAITKRIQFLASSNPTKTTRDEDTKTSMATSQLPTATEN